MAGLIRYDRIKTTEARARAIRGETEKLISIAVKGHLAAQQHLASVVSDDEKAAQILAFARRGRFSLDKKVDSNEDRADMGKPPLTDKGRRFLEKKYKDRREELLRIISNEDDAEEALQAAYEAMAIELHARRRILQSLLMSWSSRRSLTNWPRAIPAVPAALPASPSWASVRAMPPTWRRSHWSRGRKHRQLMSF
jgi:ribosomal protein L17